MNTEIRNEESELKIIAKKTSRRSLENPGIRHLLRFHHREDRQDGCSKYFVTFSTYNGRSLLPSQKDCVFNAIRFWDGKKYELFAVVVLNDNVHMIIKPLTALPTIIHSIKRFTTYQINNTAVRSGKLWQDKDFDSVIENGKELLKQVEYIANNPLKDNSAGIYDNHRWSYIRS
ncbi:MAG: transposase [Nitrospirae bacterium]|nr:transposase [Nitrospirota bacterium]